MGGPPRQLAAVARGPNVMPVAFLRSRRGIPTAVYLRDLFHLLPDWPHNRVLELAPAYWKKTLENGEAQRRLNQNPLRRGLLAFVR